MKKLLFFSIFHFCTITIYAQIPINDLKSPPGNGKISGKIIDGATQQAMEYTNITIYSEKDSSLISGTITNASGRFEIAGLSYGSYFMVAKFVGFNKKYVHDISISEKELHRELGSIPLNTNSKEIPAIDITANQSRVEYKIDKKVIHVTQDLSAAGGTAADVLANTPSVDVDIDGNVTLLGSASFTVLVDGKPNGLGGSEALRQLPAALIQNIEIITNPSAKYEPDGMAGIINVIMKKNTLSGFNGIIDANIGTKGKYRNDLLLNYKTKKINFFAGYDINDNTFHGTRNIEKQSFAADTTFLNTKTKRMYSRNGHTIKSGIDYFAAEKTTISLTGDWNSYNFNRNDEDFIHNYNNSAAFNNFTKSISAYDRHTNLLNSNLSLQHKFNSDGSHKLDAFIYYSKDETSEKEGENEYLSDSKFYTTGKYISRVRTTNNEDENEYQLQADYTLPLKNDGKFEAGWLTNIDQIDNDFIFQNNPTGSGTWTNNPQYTSRLKVEDDIHAAYSTITSKWGTIGYELGLRAEYSNREINHYQTSTRYKLEKFNIFPTLHLSHDFANEDQVMLSYSRRVNRPRIKDLNPLPSYQNRFSIRIGNPELKPEFIDSYNFSYIKKIKSGYLSLESYYMIINDRISYTEELHNDGIYYTTIKNLDKNYLLSSELMADITATSWLSLNASTSIYHYRIKGELPHQLVNRESTNFNGKLSASIKLSPTTRMQLMSSISSSSVAPQGQNKGVFYTNLSFRQDFMKRKLSATIGIQDLLRTMKSEVFVYGPNFSSWSKMTRESPVVSLTLSYKINNYKNRETNSTKSSGLEMEF